ncbi:MAG: PhzF family phenazine biosynthesis isomerase [Xanthomonadaceae bacterium]|nr:PhzF family phenazine biosynthesis isomerase [Xanthomonadaceae bacterium]
MGQRHCRLFHVDAFTRQRFRGNPAIVVLNADDLSEEEMQTIAAEVNGETAFLLEAEANDHDMQVKFFTPRHPVPFVGHATIAAQYVYAKTFGPKPGKLRQRTGAGIVEIEVNEVDGDYRIAITQSPPMLGPTVPDHHRRQVLNALGISSPSLHIDCPLQILTKGSNRLLIGLKSPDLLGSLKPDFEELARLTPHVGAEGYFVFALTKTNGAIGTISRMFCPALGIPEDPVSGNAHGMLGVYLIDHGLITPTNGRVAFRGHQGRWVRRDGVVDVEVETSGKVAQSVRIVGDAVIVYEAEVQV